MAPRTMPQGGMNAVRTLDDEERYARLVSQLKELTFAELALWTQPRTEAFVVDLGLTFEVSR